MAVSWGPVILGSETQMLARLPPGYKVRLYPDICHTLTAVRIQALDSSPESLPPGESLVTILLPESLRNGATEGALRCAF